MRVLGAPEDVLEGAEPEEQGRGRPRWAALAVAAALGFAAANVVDRSPAGPRAEPSLAVVVGRQPPLESVGDAEPWTTMEVTLVNTGPSAVRLDGAVVQGSDLAWDADRSLEPGQQLPVVLREERPCDREPDVLSGSGAGPQRLQVRLRGGRDGGSSVDLAMPPTVGLLYDDHVRAVCRLPRLPQALEVVQDGSTVEDGALVLEVGLQSVTVRPLQLVEVRSSRPGVTATLTFADGRPVPLPLDVAARTRLEIAQGWSFDDPSTTPYRVRLSADPSGCAALRASSSGEGFLSVVFVDADDPATTAERAVFADPGELLRAACS